MGHKIWLQAKVHFKKSNAPKVESRGMEVHIIFNFYYFYMSKIQ